MKNNIVNLEQNNHHLQKDHKGLQSKFKHEQEEKLNVDEALRRITWERDEARTETQYLKE
jgi:hypothetical protein